MTESINQGDFEAYPAGTQMLVRVRSGEVKLGDHPNTAQRQIASYTPDNGWISWTPSHAQRLVVYAVEAAEVDVQYNDGFSISLFGLPVLDVDSSSPNAPDYRNQTTRIPAEGVVEVSGDQTQNIPSGGSVTSTVTADSNEVWELTGFLFSHSESGVDIEVLIQSEAQGVEYGFAARDAPPGNEQFYRSGVWGIEGSSWDAARDSILEDHRIDDTNGVEVVVKNTDGSDTMTETRTIRFVFQVIRA